MVLVYICLCLISIEPQTFKAIKTSHPPVIDGFLEETWFSGDSAYNFTQYFPGEYKPSTEKTTVYILYTKDDLYIGFQCQAHEPKKIDFRITPRDIGRGDEISIILDPLCSEECGYRFDVNCAGIQSDAYISSNGISHDYRWDGVWYSAAKVTKDGYTVEVQIPFKSIRYSPNSNVWHVNFLRYIASKGEKSCWSPLRRVEGIRLSRCGKLVAIQPGKRGIHLELYPVVLGRYEKFQEETFSFDACFDASWNIQPSSKVCCVVNPDFAQIESDPYRVNLSKYTLYFPERRSFFIEGSKISEPSNIQFQFGDPLALFYSRQIGKKLPGGKIVPILTGLKSTTKGKDFEIGILNCITNKVTYTDMWNDISEEPLSDYYVIAGKKKIMKNSTLGFLYEGKESKFFYQRVLSLNDILRKGNFECSVWGATSWNTDISQGFAGELSWDWFGDRFWVGGNYKNIGEDFEINEIGYAPCKFIVYSLIGGPIIYEKFFFKSLFTGIGGTRRKEYGEPEFGYSIWGIANGNLRNNWGTSINFQIFKDFEIDRWYKGYRVNTSFWTDASKVVWLKPSLWYTSYAYNFRRGFFAAQGGGDIYTRWKLNPSMNLELSINNTIEWRPDGSIEKSSWVFRPIVQWTLIKDLYLHIYIEPNTDTHIYSLNTLLSWNFRPKSWIYLALNEVRDNKNGNMQTKERIFILKVKNLFFM